MPEDELTPNEYSILNAWEHYNKNALNTYEIAVTIKKSYSHALTTLRMLEIRGYVKNMKAKGRNRFWIKTEKALPNGSD